MICVVKHSSVNDCSVSQPKTKKAPAVVTAAAAGNASSHLPSASLLDAPLDRMMADPWARPTVTSPWGDQVDTVAASQPGAWTSRRSPSPGQILAHISLIIVIIVGFLWSMEQFDQMLLLMPPNSH